MAAGTCAAALEDVDIEAIGLFDKARIFCVELGQPAVAVRRRVYEPGELKLELIVGAYDDMEMLLPVVRQMLEVIGENLVESCPLD
ncbi:MAG: hypothetical protein E6J25_05895 [Chloroflexi bacterium]|nr:MAG: hypothetical protein E6J25_05895 [Chloroflexota bacterium]